MYRAVCNDAVIGEFDDFKPAFDTVLNFAIGKIGDRDFKGVSVQIDNKKAFEIDFMGDEYVCGVPVESTEDDLFGGKLYSVQHREKLINKLVYGKDIVKRFEIGKIYKVFTDLYKVISRNKDFVTFIDAQGKKMRRKVWVSSDVEFFYPLKDKRQYGTRIYDDLRADSLYNDSSE